MAYTRWNESGYYIFDDQTGIVFEDKHITNELVDIFIYNLCFDMKDLLERYKHGKELTIEFLKKHNDDRKINFIEECERKMFDELEKEYGFDFRTLAKKPGYSDLKNDLSFGMVAEETSKYGKEEN